MAKGSNSNSWVDNQETIKRLIIIIIVILLVAVFFLYRRYQDDPTRVFNRMLNNTLSTASYSKTITNESNGQNSTQVINVQTGSNNRVIEIQNLNVPGVKNGGVSVYAIGTPTTDYSKYTKLNTSAKNHDGQLINYSPILNVWTINKPGQIFNQTVLDIVPIANINPTLKKQFLNYLHTYNVYNYSGIIKSETLNGRAVLVYPVKIKMYFLDYYLYQFSHAVGLTQGKVEAIGKEPKSDTTRQVTFYIDTSSSQLAQITFNGSNQKYVFSGYGATQPNVPIPVNTIPIATFENNLQALINK